MHVHELTPALSQKAEQPAREIPAELLLDVARDGVLAGRAILKAAAATAVAVAVGTLSVSPTRPFTPEVRADRPFVFAIRDVQTGTILFLGRFADPTGTAVPRKT